MFGAGPLQAQRVPQRGIDVVHDVACSDHTFDLFVEPDHFNQFVLKLIGLEQQHVTPHANADLWYGDAPAKPS
jgi:hypothetical protein